MSMTFEPLAVFPDAIGSSALKVADVPFSVSLPSSPWTDVLVFARDTPIPPGGL